MLLCLPPIPIVSRQGLASLHFCIPKPAFLVEWSGGHTRLMHDHKDLRDQGQRIIRRMRENWNGSSIVHGSALHSTHRACGLDWAWGPDLGLWFSLEVSVPMSHSMSEHLSRLSVNVVFKKCVCVCTHVCVTRPQQASNFILHSTSEIAVRSTPEGSWLGWSYWDMF